jgi:hypothetical protein
MGGRDILNPSVRLLHRRNAHVGYPNLLLTRRTELCFLGCRMASLLAKPCIDTPATSSPCTCSDCECEQHHACVPGTYGEKSASWKAELPAEKYLTSSLTQATGRQLRWMGAVTTTNS